MPQIKQNSMTNEELWQSVLAQIQFSVSRANFATWFKNTKIINKEDGCVTISVENSFSKEWLSNKYSNLILKILRELDEEIKSLEFVVNPKRGEEAKANNNARKKKSDTIESLFPQIQFQELTIDKETNLNPKYTFDNFIVGRFNELAQAAAWAISESPGASYNPLFVYGGVGLGKTHLLQATGNRIVELHPDKKVKYIPCERFVSGVVEALRNKKMSTFKRQLKAIDVLIMDDVQFFAGKEKSQEEFFHIFNLFHQSQKQIILSSDRPPKAIPTLEERLRSRFEGGMMVDIGVPDFETRLAILKAKCVEKEIELDEEILEFIASNIRTNIREMEGALNNVVFFKKINNKNPKIEEVKKLLNNIIHSPKKKTTYKKIISVISEFYGLDKKELLTETRRKEIVKPRQIAMFLLREELKESYPSIGRRFGGKDHTTAIYACNKITKEIEENEELLNEINLIKQRLYSEIIVEKVRKNKP
jgi:chromosomal replication initiator protein